MTMFILFVSVGGLFECAFSLTVSKVSKNGVFSAPYFPAFSPNTGKYGPEKTPNLDTFHAVPATILNESKDF